MVTSPAYQKSLGTIAKNLWPLALVLAFSGCGSAKKSETCKLEANGLRLEGWNGQSLSDLELSLVFLKGPTEVTEKIGEYLETQQISATFFAMGEEASKEEEVLKHLKDEGHVIGTGGFSFTGLGAAEDPVLELKAADAVITEHTIGNQFWLYGEKNSLSANALKQLRRAGLGKYVGPIHEDTDPASFVSDEQCWKNGSAVSVCTANYLTELQRIRKGIVAFHDEDPKTEELLRELIPELVAFGFTFKRLDQVPDLRIALSEGGGLPDATKANKSCDDYE